MSKPYRKGGGNIKKVVITIMLFAISIGLILGVIMPIAKHGKQTGNDAYQKSKQIGTSIEEIF